jgi:hypothetical protein
MRPEDGFFFLADSNPHAANSALPSRDATPFDKLKAIGKGVFLLLGVDVGVFLKLLSSF